MDYLSVDFVPSKVGGDAVGRLVFKLFADKTPKAAENFRVLCTGEQASAGASRVRPLREPHCDLIKVDFPTVLY